MLICSTFLSAALGAVADGDQYGIVSLILFICSMYLFCASLVDPTLSDDVYVTDGVAAETK